MKTFTLRYFFAVFLTCLFALIQCSRWSRDYSILESSPYADYSSNVIPEPIDGSQGMSLLWGGNYVNTFTDTDSSIKTLALNLGLRSILFDNFESGIAFTTTLKDSKMYGHGAFDIKINLAERPLVVCPDLGFGAGLGKIAWSFSLRPMFIIGYEILDDYLTIYAIPRYVGLFYPWHAEGSSLGAERYTYALANAYGVSGGFSLSLPISGSDGTVHQTLKFKPELSFFTCQEPRLNQTQLSVFQIGCQMYFSF